MWHCKWTEDGSDQNVHRMNALKSRRSRSVVQSRSSLLQLQSVTLHQPGGALCSTICVGACAACAARPQPLAHEHARLQAVEAAHGGAGHGGWGWGAVGTLLLCSGRASRTATQQTDRNSHTNRRWTAGKATGAACSPVLHKVGVPHRRAALEQHHQRAASKRKVAALHAGAAGAQGCGAQEGLPSNRQRASACLPACRERMAPRRAPGMPGPARPCQCHAMKQRQRREACPAPLPPWAASAPPPPSSGWCRPPAQTAGRGGAKQIGSTAPAGTTAWHDVQACTALLALRGPLPSQTPSWLQGSPLRRWPRTPPCRSPARPAAAPTAGCA